MIYGVILYGGVSARLCNGSTTDFESVCLGSNPCLAANGIWLSLVEHLLWEQGVASSNLAIPTIRTVRELQCGICQRGAMAAQLFCKQSVVGSSPTVGSIAKGDTNIRMVRSCLFAFCKSSYQGFLVN